MQKPKPTNATGVQVHLTAIDPNDNYQDIGYATTDNNGNYGILWTPPVEGLYKVIATFAGTESYGDSDATTYMGVGPAQTAATPAVVITAPPPTATPTNPATNPTPSSTATVAPTPSPVVVPPTSVAPVATYIAIGVVVIIVIAAAAALALRKRK